MDSGIPTCSAIRWEPALLVAGTTTREIEAEQRLKRWPIFEGSTWWRFNSTRDETNNTRSLVWNFTTCCKVYAQFVADDWRGLFRIQTVFLYVSHTYCLLSSTMIYVGECGWDITRKNCHSDAIVKPVSKLLWKTKCQMFLLSTQDTWQKLQRKKTHISILMMYALGVGKMGAFIFEVAPTWLWLERIIQFGFHSNVFRNDVDGKHVKLLQSSDPFDWFYLAENRTRHIDSDKDRKVFKIGKSGLSHSTMWVVDY